MKSTKARKAYIHEVLVLLKATGSEAWDIEILMENLSQWPEDGDILDLVTDLRVIEVDGEGQPITDSSIGPPPDPVSEANGHLVDPASKASVHLVDLVSEASEHIPTNQDDSDAGPALLQNDIIPDETFEGIANVFDNSSVNTGQANLIEQAIMSQV